MVHPLSPTSFLPALATLHACTATRIAGALRALRDVYFPHTPSSTPVGAVPVLRQTLSETVPALRPKRMARLVHHDGVPDSGYASAEEDDQDDQDEDVDETLERGYAINWLTGLVKRGDA
ncbi:hypothetical protein JVT61DRAFT_5021 [Boletus reticuloceps]|uniref:Uncharacterized protein n=1 Tax=Boletus reticuloceps TaxID=495285 RepID=A0A8I2YY35_9AGAM|nr:hypothetical protein JVT61DRAFT_5021 [Boletus reticuloceps]